MRPFKISDLGLADPGAAERQRRWWSTIAPRQLRLIGDATMLDAIGKARVRRLAAEIEVRLARVADRPFADAIVELEKARFVGDLGARLGGN